MLDPRTLILRWFDEVWNQGREATVDELFIADGVGHGLGEEADVIGPNGFKVFMRNMRNAFPDVHVEVEDSIVEGEKAAVRIHLVGTHLGEGLGMPPSGNRVSIRGMVIVRVVSGQIHEAWNTWDQLGLLKQISAPPEPRDPDRFLTARP